MNKKFTFLIIFLTCLKVSAFAIHADTTRLARPDTAKLLAALGPKERLRLSSQLIHGDSLKLTPVIRQEAINQSRASNGRYSIALEPVMRQPGNIRLSALTIDDYSIKVPAPLPYAYSRKIAEALRYRDSLKQQVKINQRFYQLRMLVENNPDSLKREAKHVANDTMKALFYSRIAIDYLQYDTVSNKKKQLAYQNEAINYTILALQQYSTYNDTTGLRMSFDNLAKVYYVQKKYSQAKWFALQSSALSRAKNDVPGIISSLITLSAIKSDIKDYTLAKQDLDEALLLSNLNHSPKTELDILKRYVFLCNKLQDHPKEALMIKKRDSLAANIRKVETLKLAAQKKKTDSAQNKKKVYTANLKKVSGKIAPKKVDSL